MSLIEIMRNIDDRFIITFYSAFRTMYHDYDSAVQSIYDQQYKKYIHSINDDYVYFLRPDRSGYRHDYRLGLFSLSYFSVNNHSEWGWLKSQINKGIFMEAYTFYDRNLTYSTENDLTKTPIKVYLAIQMHGVPCTNCEETIVSTNNATLIMYTLDTSKSIYRFIVKENRVYEAIFFIWSYFSSENYNKRQEFEYILRWKELFGIRNFYKDQPLEYKRGIGFYDSRWPYY